MAEINDAFWRFVHDNINADAGRLRLKYHKAVDMGYDVGLAITQIECRRRFGKKLRQTLQSDPRFLFPSVIAGEQSTSDLLASFHASLTAEGERVVDLTCGLGIDALHMSRTAALVDAVDIDASKAEALAYNARNIDRDNVRVMCGDCTELVGSIADGQYDTAFVDPARRGDAGQRVYALSDCQPDVVAMMPQIRRICRRLIVKMSPMLDITHTALSLPGTARVMAIGTTTECRELVAVVDCMSTDTAYDIQAVTLRPDGTNSLVTYTPEQEAAAVTACSYGAPREGAFLYEPYPAVMKAGPMRLLSARYGLHKLHANTHLYTSDSLAEGFPGDAYRIERVIPYASKNIKRLKREYPTISVTTRNFDMAADALRHKLGVSDGGDRRLFGVTTSGDQRVMIVCHEL